MNFNMKTKSLKMPVKGPDTLKAVMGRGAGDRQNAMGFRLNATALRRLLENFAGFGAGFPPAGLKIASNSVDVANAAPDEVTVSAGGLEPLPVDDAANAESPARWYRLASYKDYPHPMGLQRVDRTAANAMANHMGGIVRRVRDWLSQRNGPPVYRGHPDDPGMSGEPGHEDFTAYANVGVVEPREDGVYVRIDWKPEGTPLRQSGLYRLSPRWGMALVDQANRVFRPVKLLSVGLTPTPNLSDAAYANARPPESNTLHRGMPDATNNKKHSTMKEIIKTLLAALGFSNERITATTDGGADAVSLSEAKAQLERIRTDAANEKTKREKAETDLANEKSAREKAETACANERRERARLEVDLAVANHCIPAADRDAWEKKLAEAEDYVAAANELTGKRTGPKGQSRTGDLTGRTGGDAAANAAKQRYQDMVNAKISEGKTYESAVNAVMATPEGRKAWDDWREAAKADAEEGA